MATTYYRRRDVALAAGVAEDDRLALLDLHAPEVQEIEGPTCPICDGLGHGYPGAGPCPIESPDPLYYADEMAAGR